MREDVFRVEWLRVWVLQRNKRMLDAVVGCGGGLLAVASSFAGDGE